MEMPRFSVFEADVYAVRTILDNIRLFVLTALAKIAFFVGYLLITGLISLLFITRWDPIVSFLNPLLACRTQEECFGIIRNQIQLLPTLYLMPGTQTLALLIFFIVSLFLGFGIYLGFIRVVLTLHDTGKSTVHLLFSCFGLVPKFIVAGFLYSIMVTVGLVLFVIPGIYLALRFYLFSYFIVDTNAGIIDSLRKSFKATEGQAWPLFGVFILFPAIMAMPGGIFFITPFITTAMAYVYRKLT